MENLARVLTRQQAIEQFEEHFLPEIKKVEISQGQVDTKDIPLRCESWNNWTDSLCKDNQISDWQYENWTHPDFCE